MRCCGASRLFEGFWRSLINCCDCWSCFWRSVRSFFQAVSRSFRWRFVTFDSCSSNYEREENCEHEFVSFSSLLHWFCRSVPSVDFPTVVCQRWTYSVCLDCAFQVRAVSAGDDRRHSAVLISIWYFHRTTTTSDRDRTEERWFTLRCFSAVSVFIRVHDCSLASKRTWRSFTFFSRSLIVLRSSSFSWFDWFKRSL